MTYIYIDTNIFLDFYQSATEPIAVFEELEKQVESIILTEQTIHEFARNRTARLMDLADKIEKSAVVNIHTTSVVRDTAEYKAWIMARNAAKIATEALVVKMRSWIEQGELDPVFSSLSKLLEDGKTLFTTSDLIEKAKTRKLLGEPPTSPDKHTIGDELIWETLLEGCKSDLIIVSRDKTFSQNASLLKSEFDSSSRKLIAVTDKVSAALKMIGKPAEKIEEAEKVIEAVRVPKESGDASTCPQCGGSIKRRAYDDEQGVSCWSLECSACGFHETF